MQEESVNGLQKISLTSATRSYQILMSTATMGTNLINWPAKIGFKTK